MNKKTLLSISAVVVIVTLGFAGYWQIAAKKAAAEASVAETAVAQRGNISITMDASGSLVSPIEFTLAFPVAGKVYEITALEGQTVHQGDLLARLEQARRNFENTRLSAPADGVVITIFFQDGEYASPGAPVAIVNGLTALEAEVNLDEADISYIQLGMPVVVTVDAFPDQILTGQVTQIALSANVQSSVVLYPVTVRLDPTDLPLRSGMTVNVAFPVEERTDILLVPYRAVETEGGQAYVTRVTISGSERVAVTMGLVTDTQIEILSGLEDGDVVTVYANPVQDTANPVQDTAVMHSPTLGGGQ